MRKLSTNAWTFCPPHHRWPPFSAPFFSRLMRRIAEKLVVTTDRAKIIKLPDQTKTVIVGNPIIADVTIGKDGLVILTGKSFGTTNLIALDGTAPS